jgi:hypothetical protein
MLLTCVGCAVRCGPNVLGGFEPSDLTDLPYTLLGNEQDGFEGSVLSTGVVGGQALSRQQASSFRWLVVGQALCALGQPFLVNTTSQVGAEWFHPSERPAVAMVLSLMNFLGSSCSFMMPPMFVEIQEESVRTASTQVASLLVAQLVLAVLSCLLTVLFFQASPLTKVPTAHRAQVTFREEVRRFLGLRDFWLVNMQFAFYVGVCHAFDAIEGSLLERYGYSAALSSRTAISCAFAAVLSTIVESLCITNPSAYRPVLIAVNGILAFSTVMACACLYFRLHEMGFVLAVFLMGLATPGWGCSFELGSEVCFPARESTVVSFLEACSNLMGVVAIMVAQALLDYGIGAGVLLVMALASLASSGLVLCLTGRLRRSEAEAMQETELEATEEVDLGGQAIREATVATRNGKLQDQPPSPALGPSLGRSEPFFTNDKAWFRWSPLIFCRSLCSLGKVAEGLPTAVLPNARASPTTTIVDIVTAASDEDIEVL